MRALAREVGAFPTTMPQLSHVATLLHDSRKQLQFDIPALHVLLGDHRRGAHTITVANAIRAHNLRNQLQIIDLLLTNLILALPKVTTFAEFAGERGPALAALARTCDLVARSSQRSSNTAVMAPLAVTFLNESFDAILSSAVMAPIRANLGSARGGPWIGVEVDADEPLLVESFTNLVVNAVAAMKENGGTRLNVDIGSRSVLHQAPSPAGIFRAVQPTKDGEHITYTISDTGPGMRDDRMIAYWNGQSTKGQEGNGLGLPHIAWVVRAHHGFIEVSSELGVGTSITVGLPLRSVEAPRAFTVAKPGVADAPELLIIDDNHDTADSLALLAKLSLEKNAVPAYSGADALKAVVKGKKQLVALDLTIPGESASETLAAIRAANPEAVVWIVSGFAAGEKWAELEKAADGWWIKPVDTVTFFAKVREVLP